MYLQTKISCSDPRHMLIPFHAFYHEDKSSLGSESLGINSSSDQLPRAWFHYIFSALL